MGGEYALVLRHRRAKGISWCMAERVIMWMPTMLWLTVRWLWIWMTLVCLTSTQTLGYLYLSNFPGKIDLASGYLFALCIDVWFLFSDRCRGGVNAMARYSQGVLLSGGMHSDPSAHIPRFKNDLVSLRLNINGRFHSPVIPCDPL